MILITGTTSAIGRVAKSWCEARYPHENIVTLSRGGTENSNHIVYDVLNDKLPEWKTRKFDTVIHLLAAVPATAPDDKCFDKVNFDGSMRLFQNLPLKPHAKILNISSASVYDDPAVDILSEDSKKTQSDFYGQSKLKFEQFLSTMHSPAKHTILSVRVPVLLAYGVENNFISKWKKNLSQENRMSLFNSKALFNSCIWAEDIFTFFENFSKKFQGQNTVCNIAASQPITIEAAAQRVSHDLGYKSPNIVVNQTSRKAQLFDIKLAEKFGYKPRNVIDTLSLFCKE